MKKIIVLLLTLLFLLIGTQSFSKDLRRNPEFSHKNIQGISEVITVGNKRGYIKFSHTVISPINVLEILESIEQAYLIEITYWIPDSSYFTRLRGGLDKSYIGIWFEYY